jgi:hypothetical protein
MTHPDPSTNAHGNHDAHKDSRRAIFHAGVRFRRALQLSGALPAFGVAAFYS